MAGLCGSVANRPAQKVSNETDPPQWLPSGACSFRDLGGVNTQTCGCQRFWLNVPTSPHAHGDDRSWCFCGHHACFHKAALSSAVAPSSTTSRNIQAAAPAPAQPSTSTSAPRPTLPLTNCVAGIQKEGQHTPEARATSSSKAAGLGIIPHNAAISSVDVRLWHALNEFARGQDGKFPDTSAALPSTAVPSIADEPRESPMRVMSARLQQQQQRDSRIGPPVNIPQGIVHYPRTDEYSATELATPSINGSPDICIGPMTAVQPYTSPRHIPPGLPPSVNSEPRPSIERPVTAPPAPVVARESSPDTKSIVRDIYRTLHDQSLRLGVLETMSFSASRVEDAYDKMDLVDTRILDLEHWRIEQDKMQEAADNSSSAGERSRNKRRLPLENSSFASDLSDTDAAAHTEAVVLATLAANAETHPRIEALETRIDILESHAGPSYHYPWHVQVVLLPFGRQLPGIWFSSSESTQQSLRSANQAEQEWSALQSAPNSSFQSVSDGAWTTESIEAWANQTQESWLSAKACGPTSTAFERLESRGFVRNMMLTAPDAAHALAQIARTFKDLPVSGDRPVNRLDERFGGLKEAFIPLKKMRKSSRLRFLSQAEMTTSTTWNASFLDSSVFMKLSDGQRRLFISTAHAYLQPAEVGCSWPALRNLPVYSDDGEMQAAQASGRVIEQCWTYHDRLDRAVSFNQFLTEQDLWSIRSHATESDQQAISVADSRPAHVRSTSLPSAASLPTAVTEAGNKRRAASFEVPAVESITTSPRLDMKRRRTSGSQEARRSGAGLTPRWSHPPPTPFTHVSMEEANAARSHGQGTAKRGVTPQAYATPHSNSYTRSDEEFILREGDVLEDEVSVEYNEHGDETDWEGVQDGTDTQPLENGLYAHDSKHGPPRGLPTDLASNDDELDEGMSVDHV